MRGFIRRDIDAAAERDHDLIVVGGGIQGVCTTLEAALRGLRTLLIERDDFGAAASRSSLRIIHGGFRYLQTLDIARFRESVRERAWFMGAFPELIRPLTCVMPLYGDGLRRPALFRAALGLNRVLTGVFAGETGPAHATNGGGVLSAAETAAIFPPTPRTDLQGAGVWQDGLMVSPERVLTEMLRHACGRGARALNAAEALAFERADEPLIGLRIVDRVSGRELVLHSRRVAICTGTGASAFAPQIGRSAAAASPPSLAFNVLLERSLESGVAVAVSPRGARRANRTYFLVPCHGGTMAGTFHAPYLDVGGCATPTPEQLAEFVDDLNAAVPALGVSVSEIAAVYAGVIPADAPGSAVPADRPAIIEHARHGGPAGVWTICGVKYTTARAVARRAVSRMFPGRVPFLPGVADSAAHAMHPESWAWLVDARGPVRLNAAGEAALRRLVREESVLHLEDLVLRRSAWGLHPADALAIGARIVQLLGWNAQRCRAELLRLGAAVRVYAGPACSEAVSPRAVAALVSTPGTVIGGAA